MSGKGIVHGLGVTLRHLLRTYWDDLKKGRRRYFNPEGIAYRQSPEVDGIFTVQYPEEKLPVPEEFRYLPFLVYDPGPAGEKVLRCTSCGICAKVCPPQCIWITRTTDPETGKPVPTPAEFAIDIDICMNCGLCAEYCPFDAIKMDHDYEIAGYDRMTTNIYTIEQLARSADYYRKIRPNAFASEEKDRLEREAAKAARAGTG